MKVTVDTNILIRAVVSDDPVQATAAAGLLRNAEVVAVTLPCLCEFVWVLRRVYRFPTRDIAQAVDALLNAANVALYRAAVEAGLAVLNAGGDFADGLIAYEGAWLGGETFMSFDRRAVALIAAQGSAAQVLATV